MLSYTELAVDLADANAYAAARGWSDWTGPDDLKTAALRRGQDFIAATYNGRWLEDFDNDAAPEAVRFAIIEAARRELASPGSLAPDLKRGGRIKAVGAGSSRVEFAGDAPGGTTFQFERLLSGLVAARSIVAFSSRA